jgi:hypothetical protein
MYYGESVLDLSVFANLTSTDLSHNNALYFYCSALFISLVDLSCINRFHSTQLCILFINTTLTKKIFFNYINADNLEQIN